MRRIVLLIALGVLASSAGAEAPGDDELCRQGAIGRGDLDEAIAACTRALEPGWFPLKRPKPESLASLFINRSILHGRRGQLNQAIADAGAAIELDVNNPQFYSIRASLYLRRGELDRAIADLDRALRLDPDNPQAHVARGYAHARMGEFGQARDDYAKALKLDPESREAREGLYSIYVNLGLSSGRQGEFDRAVEEFDRAIRLDPGNPQAHVARGYAHARMGELGQARDDYAKALELDPENQEARDGLARVGGRPAEVRSGGAEQPEAGPGQKEEPPPQPRPLADWVGQQAATPEPSSGVAGTAMPQEQLVRLVQEKLIALGYDLPRATGHFGELTRRAIRAFAHDRKLVLPEAPDQALVAALDQALAQKRAAASAPGALPAPSGEDPAALIRRLQAGLRELGYGVSAVTGKVGPQTRAAIERFARDSGLAAAVPDEALLALVEGAVAKRRVEVAAAQGERIRRAQAALEALGYDPGPANGVLGPQARRALAAWQRDAGRPPAPLDEEMLAVLEREAAAPGERAGQPGSEPVPGPSASADRNLSEGGSEPAGRVAPPPGESAAPAPETAVGPPAWEPPPRAAAAVQAPQERRLALVIGNSAYTAIEPLRNPRHDAEDMAKALESIGFEVLKGFDLDRNAMEDLILQFARKAERADFAFAYYSGHGLQFNGMNYMVPVDARIEDRYDLQRLIHLDDLIQYTGAARRLALVAVDACRDNPLLARMIERSLGLSRAVAPSKGLAQPRTQLPSQMLVAYAANLDQVAADGWGRNSPFTEALLRHLTEPNLEVRFLFGRVRDDVIAATENTQQPTIFGALGGEQVYLVRTPPRPAGLGLEELTLQERQAIQRSLDWLGYWQGPADGEVSPDLVVALRRYQTAQGAEDPDRLSAAEAVALHRRAARSRPPEPLPAIDLGKVFQGVEEKNPEAQRLVGMMYDPAFAASPLGKDRARAIRNYELAAARGDQVATVRLGLLLTRQPDSSKAETAAGRMLLERVVRDPLAALRLAELILDGASDEAEQARARDLLKIAAASPETGGIAAARLRLLGEPAASVQGSTAARR